MARSLFVLKLLFVITSIAIASESEKIYEGYKVYDIKTKSEDELTFLKNLEADEGYERSLDFLSLHNRVGDVAQLAVMPSEQRYIENLFKSKKIDYRVKTKNLQE